MQRWHARGARFLDTLHGAGGFKDGPDRSPRQEEAPLSSDDRFFAVLGLLSLAGGCIILLVETQFSQLAGWFGVISGAGLFLFLAYRLIRRR